MAIQVIDNRCVSEHTLPHEKQNAWIGCDLLLVLGK